MTLTEMKARRSELLNTITALQASDATDATEKLVNVLDEAEKLDATIAAKERAEALQNRLAAPAPRAVKPGAPTAPARTVTAENKLDALIAALPFGAHRVMNAAGDLFQEGQAADGGYLLPVDKRALVKLLAPPEMVHGMCDILYTPSNATTVPVDEDPAWSGDLAANDVAEGADLTEDKLAFKSVDVTLAKAGVLVRVTREMLEDTTGIAEYVNGKLAEKLSWKLHARCITAFLAAGGAKVTVPKTAGAAAGSPPDLANIQAIWASMLAPMRSKAVWLANPRIEPALQSITIGTIPVYIPAGGLSDAPFGKLFGRPVMFVEGMPAVGTEGDLVLVDPSSFWCVLKTQGPRIEESIHAEFKNDVVQYRGYVRSACKSKFSAPLVRADGTSAGNVVTLATRE